MNEQQDMLRDLLRSSDKSMVSDIGDALRPHLKSIVRQFYDQMLKDSQSIVFLSHERVEKKLQLAMQKW